MFECKLNFVHTLNGDIRKGQTALTNSNKSQLKVLYTYFEMLSHNFMRK